MKILVATLLLGLVAFSYADDDSDEVTDFDHDDDDLPLMKMVSHPIALNVPIPATFPQVRTVASPAPVNLPTPVAHGASLSPAVMKIPKPGIKFNIPQPQTHISNIPVETAVPVPAVPQPIQMVMPKTSLKTVEPIPAIPTPVTTLKTAAAPLPVTLKTAATPVPVAEPMTQFMPVSTLKAAELSMMPFRHMMPATTMFRHNIQSLPMPYYSSSINYGYHSVLDAPALIRSTFVAPQESISSLPAAAIAVSTDSEEVETVPIQYTTTSNIAAIPTSNVPFLAGPFQAKVMETSQQPLHYWTDFQTPQQMTNFMDLSTGGFSYINVIGDRSTIVPQSDSIEVGHLFKAIHSQIPKVQPIMETKATPATAAAVSEPQNAAVVAA